MLAVAAAGARVRAQSPDYRGLWRDPEVQARIHDGIRAHRMGYARFRVLDAAGKPVSGARIQVKQLAHEFLFGSNLFLLKGFDTEEKNRAYERGLTGLFNYGTAPFYWGDLEPEQGRPRFAAGSKPVYRRPPPDLVLDWARRNGVRVKGHPLLWHQFLPKWLPGDAASVERLAAKRLREIAARYASGIYIWDVVNEPLERPLETVLPRDYVYWAFREAGRSFPTTTTLTLNEVTSHWSNFRHETSPFYLLIDALRRRGSPVRCIGLQFHLFSETLYADVLRGQALRPLDLLRVLDRYSDFRLPIHITEITIPTLPDTAEGRQAQAELTADLYRLWFSHPSVEAITWWNLADGTAVGNENRWNGGLLDRDLKPKPSYAALERLIRREWHSEGEAETNQAGEAALHVFHGRYQVTARSRGATSEEEILLSRHGGNRFEIHIP